MSNRLVCHEFALFNRAYSDVNGGGEVIVRLEELVEKARLEAEMQ